MAEVKENDAAAAFILNAIQENIKSLSFPENKVPTQISIVISYPETKVSHVFDVKKKEGPK